MSYDVTIDVDAREFLKSLDDKSQRICKENLLKLEDDPHPRPGSGSGDKEKIVFEGREVYRLHIGRSYTAIYDILEDDQVVQILELLPIDEAHKRYGH